jgi:hypothetical protein
MRGWAGLLALAFMTTPAHADEQLAVALERAGYFTSIDDAVATRVRHEIVTNGPAGAMRHPYRVAPVNTQTLAQGGVGSWVQSLTPVLASRGVTFRPAEDRLTGDRYTVAIGANEYLMWQAGETNTEQASTIAAFGMVNGLLESIGSPERLYMTGEGAAAQAWLLTPVQADIIRNASPQEAWPRLPGQVMPAPGTMPALTLPPQVTPAQPTASAPGALQPDALSQQTSAQPIANEGGGVVQPR